MEVNGFVNTENQIVYKCPSCLRKHTHSWVVGESTLHRISHCPIDDRSVQIKVENFQEAMEAQREKRRDSNVKAAKNYYEKNKETVQARRLLKKVQNGYAAKPSTLAKYNLHPELRGSQEEAISTQN